MSGKTIAAPITYHLSPSSFFPNTYHLTPEKSHLKLKSVLLNLAAKIVKDRGHHAGFEVEAARRSGATDAEIVEVLQLVSLQIFMTSLSSLSGMKIDFPLVDFQLPEKTQSEPGLKPGNQPNIPNTIETGGNESCSKEV